MFPRIAFVIVSKISLYLMLNENLNLYNCYLPFAGLLKGYLFLI